VLREAAATTRRFAKARGLPFGVLSVVVGATGSYVVTRELDLQAVVSGLAGPVVLLFGVFSWNLIWTPPRMSQRQAKTLARLQAENESLRGKLDPAIRLVADNTDEYNREFEVEVWDHSAETHRRQRRKVKLLKVENLSQQSVVVNAEIQEVEPPITEGEGPPIPLLWKDGGRGNHTLGAKGLNYLIISPPFPDFALWESTYVRTFRVSAWVQGRLGASGRFHLTNLANESLHPWITVLPDSQGGEAE
jgi:hypothetical protein